LPTASLAIPTRATVQGSPSPFEPGPVHELASMAPLSKTRVAITSGAMQDAKAQSRAWLKNLQQVQEQQPPLLMALQQPPLLMPAQEVTTLATPKPALLTPECMAMASSLAQPDLVAVITNAATDVPAQSYAEALFKAIACSKAWQQQGKHQLLMPALALSTAPPQHATVIGTVACSRDWQQQHRQQNHLLSQLQLPPAAQNQQLQPHSALPGANAQALQDAIARSRQWLHQQQVQGQQPLRQHDAALICPHKHNACRHFSFSDLGPQGDPEPPTTLRLGSLLDDSQEVADMLSRTASLSGAHNLNLSPVATYCSRDGRCHTKSDSGNITATASIVAKCEGSCQVNSANCRNQQQSSLPNTVADAATSDCSCHVMAACTESSPLSAPVPRWEAASSCQPKQLPNSSDLYQSPAPQTQVAPASKSLPTMHSCAAGINIPGVAYNLAVCTEHHVCIHNVHVAFAHC
jgi:hypothetical protein